MERYRTILRRIAAWLVDMLPFLPALVVGGIYYRHSHGTALGVAWTLALSVLGVAYSVYFHGRYGATPGKSVLKLRVVSASKEEKIGFPVAFLRESPWVVMAGLSVFEDHWGPAHMPSLVSVVSTLTGVWMLADWLVALVHPKRRALHDLIGGTVVIKEEPNKRPESLTGLRPARENQWRPPEVST